MSIYRHVVHILLSIYRYQLYAKWRINDSTSADWRYMPSSRTLLGNNEAKAMHPHGWR